MKTFADCIIEQNCQHNNSDILNFITSVKIQRRQYQKDFRRFVQLEFIKQKIPDENNRDKHKNIFY